MSINLEAIRMRTLYVRIFITTVFIMIASFILSFLATNIYYHFYLKSENDEKMTHIAKNIVDLFEENNQQDIEPYLSSMADLGYSFYLVDQDGQGESFGEPIRLTSLSKENISSVLSGHVFHGIANYPWQPFVTGFFDNEIDNTIGVPIHTDGNTYALFIRADTDQQFGEMRIFLAILLVIILVISFIGILLSTQYIVKPIKDLTDATRKIAAGNYHIKLNVNRTDEIGRLARDFTKMSNHLEKTEEKRQAFVSSVSHEIQSPLTSIQGFSQVLREEQLTEDEQKHYLSIIEKESRRLSKLSSQLLMLSFLDREDREDERVSFDLFNQLKDVISTTEWQWRQKELALELEGESTRINGNPDLLYQVWMNLITNAIQYTHPNGSISIKLDHTSKLVKIKFSDTGVGISEKDLDHLFERFYKVDKARTRKGESTGLGLSIVKKIIELHHGTIMVESELGEGSTFTVTLPKKESLK